MARRKSYVDYNAISKTAPEDRVNIPEPTQEEILNPEKMYYAVLKVPLNVRTRGDGNAIVVGMLTQLGNVEITEIQNGSGTESGWGHLAPVDGRPMGWINLDFCKKL